MFLINIVLGTMGLIAAVKLLPQDQDQDQEQEFHVPIDGLGAGLLGAAMLGLIYGLIDGSTDGWTAVPVASLIAGVALFAAFGMRQRLATDPIILPSLLACCSAWPTSRP